MNNVSKEINIYEYLPQDQFVGTLLGRAWVPVGLAGGTAGPSPVVVTGDCVFDVSGISPTNSKLLIL